jgi:hypothetical protein
MSKLFVLNGGAAVKPGNKSAYLRFEDPLKAFRNGGINTGDVLVYDAMLKALRYDHIRNLQFSQAPDESLWPKPESYDATVIRGSNYLTESLDLGHLVPLLKSLKGPVVGVGIGAQAAKYKTMDIPKGTVEAWKIIADKSTSIGVRGFYSAEVFNDIGIKNVRVIGCPSFYRSLEPSISIRPIDPETARVGLTLNKYLSADYASNTTKTNRMQRALIEAVARRPSSRLYSQGEREETLAIFSHGKEKQENIRAILQKFNLLGRADAQDMLSNRMAAFFDIDEWAADAAASIDVMVGFRLHGNVIALHQGIPAIFFTYDSRIRELSSLFAIPAVEVEDYQPINLDRLFRAADFSRVEEVYRHNYAEYHRFLSENGLSHVLPAPVAEPPASARSTPNLVHMNANVEESTAWFRSEIDFMTGEIETLRNRAWDLEMALKKATAPASGPTNKVAV